MTVTAQMVTSKGLVAQPPVVMDCFTCSGKGHLSLEEKLYLEQEKQMWCRCEKDHGSTYVDDGVSEVCSKHHWTCNHCGKIQQIG